MFYEINVSLNGKHLFATAERSIDSRYKLAFVWTCFKEKFPEADGYKLTATEWQRVGSSMSEQTILKGILL